MFCTPSPDLALRHSHVVTDPQTGRRYKVIFQNRVNPAHVRKASEVGGPNDFWYLPNACDVRAYSICLYPQ